MHCRFYSDRVVGEEQSVDVKIERYRGIAQFPDTIQGVEASRHADFSVQSLRLAFGAGSVHHR
jgi:hypothetical protein